jgi:hypothetical protein
MTVRPARGLSSVRTLCPMQLTRGYGGGIFAHAATTGLFAGFKRPLSLARCAELMARRSRQTCMSFIRLFLPSQKQNPKNNSPWQPKDGIKKHINSFAFLRTTKMLHERITNPYHSQIYHDTEQKNVHCCTPFDADFFLAGDLRDINGAALPPFASLVFSHRSRHPTRGSPIPSVRSGFSFETRLCRRCFMTSYSILRNCFTAKTVRAGSSSCGT